MYEFIIIYLFCTDDSLSAGCSHRYVLHSCSMCCNGVLIYYTHASTVLIYIIVLKFYADNI